MNVIANVLIIFALDLMILQFSQIALKSAQLVDAASLFTFEDIYLEH